MGPSLWTMKSSRMMAGHELSTSARYWSLWWASQVAGWSLVGCSLWGCEESDTTERLHFHFSLSRIGEGNGNPLQCSCLENPRDRGAWWADVYGVAQSRTRLKRLSSSRCLICVCVCVCVCVSVLNHVWLIVFPWTVAHQVPPSMEFSRQEYWNGLSFPTPGDLPDAW